MTQGGDDAALGVRELTSLRVRGGPDAVGRSTTTAVVRSTFLVIVADSVFTAIFYFVGKT